MSRSCSFILTFGLPCGITVRRIWDNNERTAFKRVQESAFKPSAFNSRCPCRRSRRSSQSRGRLNNTHDSEIEIDMLLAGLISITILSMRVCIDIGVEIGIIDIIIGIVISIVISTGISFIGISFIVISFGGASIGRHSLCRCRGTSNLKLQASQALKPRNASSKSPATAVGFCLKTQGVNR
eukprot:635809-Amorphochlora_amoeboformis.AAC.2